MVTGEIIVALIGLLTTVVSSLLTFVLTRRRYNLELDSKKIQNMDASFDCYKTITDDTIKSLNHKIEILQKENDGLRQQVNNLTMQMINLAGNICMDATCKLRKSGLSSDLKFDDSGAHVGD